MDSKRGASPAREMEDRPTLLPGLHSMRSSQRLEEIAGLRARGIGEHISLPQLVVCGDQSTGKSSVLEGITGLPFPRKDGVCTRFATEIMLTHTEEEIHALAEIIPSPLRSEEAKMELIAYKREISDFNELPEIIAEAGAMMGVRGFGESNVGPSFTQDVLRIKVSGSIGLHLTVVDLPGLIAVPSDDQTEADVQAVHDLVDTYVQNTRTIILAVVQATNDIANQGIIRKSKKFDRRGERTIGVITKPDLLNAGTENRIAALAKNQDTTRLKLGFFLLKNPSPSDLAGGYCHLEREQHEKQYFAASPWKELELDVDRTGIVPLRTYLQRLLDQHIERELPKVRKEINQLIKRTEVDLADLGDARPTPAHLRIYLSRIAMHFHRLTTAALHGDYHGVDAAFFQRRKDSFDYVRLRAMVHNVNTAFSNELRNSGQTMKVVAQHDSEADTHDSASEDLPSEPLHVSHDEMKAFVLKLYRNTRGRELPGNYNHVLLAELFHYQSKRWKAIASEHLASMFDQVKLFVQDAVRCVAADDHVSMEMLDRIAIVLEEARQKADEELEKLWDDHSQQPITYNHYYTDNIQNARRNATRNRIKQAMQDASIGVYNGKLHISNTAADAEKLLNALQQEVTVDMDDQACSEVLAGFSAYYKVSAPDCPCFRI
ncbi:hypothetical protein M433DRAFT_159716 [Acidomyces richmondensis BFW]|nr:hypothetical protein M433DRAFT_159716 [Acidomyces richmondensis BFW]